MLTNSIPETWIICWNFQTVVDRVAFTSIFTSLSRRGNSYQKKKWRVNNSCRYFILWRVVCFVTSLEMLEISLHVICPGELITKSHSHSCDDANINPIFIIIISCDSTNTRTAHHHHRDHYVTHIRHKPFRLETKLELFAHFGQLERFSRECVGRFCFFFLINFHQRNFDILNVFFSPARTFRSPIFSWCRVECKAQSYLKRFKYCKLKSSGKNHAVSRVTEIRVAWKIKIYYDAVDDVSVVVQVHWTLWMGLPRERGRCKNRQKWKIVFDEWNFDYIRICATKFANHLKRAKHFRRYEMCFLWASLRKPQLFWLIINCRTGQRCGRERAV